MNNFIISEQLFYWIISGLCMVIAFMLVWILRSLVSDTKEVKDDLIVVRDKHDNLRIDHERLSADVQALVKVVQSNEQRDNRRLDIMEKMIESKTRNR